jgi:3-hydroxyisobutyrate dehydrogenase
MRIAFLGLGAMGAPMAKNLVAAGHDLTVWNRSAARTEGFTALGARVAATPAAAAREAEVIITMLADPPAVAAVLTGPDGVLATARPGAVLVDMSTVRPEDSRRFAALAAEKGLGWLDSPVSGSVGAAESGQLIALVGGEAADLERARPALSAMCKEIHHLGPAGAGSTVKLAFNLMVGVQVLALAEAAHLAAAGGFDRQKFLALAAGSVIGSPIVKLKAPAMAAEDFTPAFALKLMKKDMALAVQEGSQLGVPLPTAAAALQSYVAGVGAGLGDLDFAAIYRVLQGA